MRLVEEEGSPSIGGNGQVELACASSGATGLCAPGLGFLGGTQVANMIVPSTSTDGGSEGGWRGRESARPSLLCPPSPPHAHPQQEGEFTFRPLWQDPQPPVHQEAGMAAYAG